jgi:hypothetical protein
MAQSLIHARIHARRRDILAIVSHNVVWRLEEVRRLGVLVVTRGGA